MPFAAAGLNPISVRFPERLALATMALGKDNFTRPSMPAKPLRLIPDIHRATHRIGIYLDSLGITQGEGHILSQLAVCGDSTISELHRALAHRRSTLTSILDRLAERSFITRESDPKDRRSFVVRLTKKGKSAAARVHQALASIEEKALGGVTNQRLQSAAELLRTLESTAERASSPVKK
jgi:DNA-binding MarR family transcriptional regulator